MIDFKGDIMERKEDKSIILLKVLLKRKITELKKDGYNFQLSNQVACLNEIINIMESNDIDSINTNLSKININLSIIYGEEEALKIEMNIRKLLRDISNYKDNPFFEEEYTKSSRKLRGIYYRFRNEKEILNNKNIELKEMLNKYEKYVYKLNYGQRFGKDQIKDIQAFLEKEGINKKVSLFILELLFIRNNEIANSTPREFMNSKIYKDKLYKLLNIGFEKYDDRIKNYSTEKELCEMGILIDNTIDCWDKYYKIFDTNDFGCQLPTLETYDKFKLYNYYVLFMEKLQNKMLEQLDNIQDKDFFMDLETKREIIFDFNKYKNLYLFVRNFYDDIFDKIIEEMRLKSNEEEQIVEEDVNKILFLRNDSDEVFLMKDLDKTNPEYLPKIVKLLKDKKAGYTVDQKNTDKQIVSNDKLRQFRELKDDQIRIIYRYLSDNKVFIIGCGTKKDNVDYKLLNTMGKRYNKYYNQDLIEHYIEQADKDFDACIEFCENNKRKGTR